jgi:hypothetical protein
MTGHGKREINMATTSIRFSLSEEELKKVQEAADRLGMSTGELFRAFVAEMLDRSEEEVEETISKRWAKEELLKNDA